MWLKKARVVAVHPEDHSIDVVTFPDGARISGVQVLAPFASSNTGLHGGLGSPGTPGSGDKWDIRDDTTRKMVAIIGFMGPGLPVCLGFLFPQVNGLSFKDGRLVLAHESGAYTSMMPDGSIESYHPSGSYVKLGTGAHASMAGQDQDGRFAQSTAAPAPTYTVSVGSGGSELAKLAMGPTGAIAVTATVSVDITAPMTTVHGNARVTGNLQVDGAITTDGDMTAGGKSFLGHVHAEHGTGGGTTSPPS